MEKGEYSSNPMILCGVLNRMNLKISSVFFWIIGLLATSCYDSGLEATTSVSDNEVQYDNTSGNRNDLVNDPYNIVGIIPGEAEWKVIVEYSGGCQTHNFVSWVEEYNTSEKSAKFYLYHNANGDLCEAFLRDTISLNITSMIPDRDILETGVVTAVNPSKNRSIEVDSELAGLNQGLSCMHSSELFGTSCGEGAWDNLWFLLSNTHSNGKNIWMQPVANSTNVALSLPDLENYKIGITFLFGHGNLSEQCENLPEGMIVPVAVNCLEKQ